MDPRARSLAGLAVWAWLALPAGAAPEPAVASGAAGPRMLPARQVVFAPLGGKVGDVRQAPAHHRTERPAGSAASVPAGTALPPAKMAGPTVVVKRSHTGIDSTQSGFQVSDNVLAAGLMIGGVRQLLEVTNGFVRITNQTGVELGSMSLEALFGVTDGSLIFDPRIVYDPYEGRFVIVALRNIVGAGGVPTASTQLIAFSPKDDATSGNWTIVEVTNDPNGNGFHGDFIDFGFSNGLWATVINQFVGAITSPTLVGVTYQVFGKPQPDGAGGFQIPLIGIVERTVVANAGAVSMRVARRRGIGNSITDGPELLFAGVPSQIGVTFSTLHLTLIGVDTAGLLVVDDRDLTVPAWNSPNVDAPQPGCASPLDVSDGRLIDLQAYGSSFYTAHTINDGNGSAGTGDDDTTIRWYHFIADPDFLAGAQLLEASTVDLGDGIFHANPSIAVNSFGEVGMMFSAVSMIENSSLWITGRGPCDDAGVMAPPVKVKVSTSCYDRGSSPLKWEDYKQVVPLKGGRRFWAVGQIFDSTNSWDTHIQEFLVDSSCPDCTCEADGGGVDQNPVGSL